MGKSKASSQVRGNVKGHASKEQYRQQEKYQHKKVDKTLKAMQNAQACPEGMLWDLFVKLNMQLSSDAAFCFVSVEANSCKENTSLTPLDSTSFPVVFGCDPNTFFANQTASCQPNLPNSKQVVNTRCSADPAVFRDAFFRRATGVIQDDFAKIGIDGRVLANYDNWVKGLSQDITSCQGSRNFTGCRSTSFWDTKTQTVAGVSGGVGFIAGNLTALITLLLIRCIYNKCCARNEQQNYEELVNNA